MQGNLSSAVKDLRPDVSVLSLLVLASSDLLGLRYFFKHLVRLQLRILIIDAGIGRLQEIGMVSTLQFSDWIGKLTSRDLYSSI